jgi:hypothetical protein
MSRKEKEFIKWKGDHLKTYTETEGRILRQVKKDFNFKNEMEFIIFIKYHFGRYFEKLFFRAFLRNRQAIIINYDQVKHDLNSYFNL